MVKGVRRSSWLAALVLAGCPGGGLLAQGLVPAAAPGVAAPGVAPQSVAAGTLELKVRRLPDAVELLIENTGPAPQMQQTSRGASWEGLLFTSRPNGLRRGPQRLSLPEAGLQSISLEGSGVNYRLAVTPLPGYPVARPVVSADGRNLILSFSAPAQVSLQTMQPNLTMPGRVGLPTAVPPLQPRAVAPPVGDLAVGTMMLSNPNFVRLSGPRVTMKLRNAPVRDALMSLAQLGGYGFVYVDEQSLSNSSDPAPAAPAAPQEKRISLSFRGETYERAINSALLAAGLQGKLDGNMILAGPAVLGKGFGPQMSKVYRLNQANAGSAADYLASLGALITKVTTTTSTSTTFATNQSNAAPGPGGLNASSGQQTAQQTNLTQTDSYGASFGPLRGLIGTTDSRLGTITLVGDPRVVAIAETYLKQLDLRQRQVALSIKILDVTLDNEAVTDNSFAFRWGNNFIVNDQGQLVANFGSLKPPAAGSTAYPGQFDGRAGSNPVVGVGNLANPTGEQINTGVFVDQPLSPYPMPGSGSDAAYGPTQPRPPFGTYTNPLQPGVTTITPPTVDPVTGRITTPPTYTYALPGNYAYPKNQFFDFVKATIESKNAKVLASPTLILQENPSLLRDAGSSGGGVGNTGASGLDAYNIDSPIGRRRGNEGVVRVGVDVPTQVKVTQATNITASTTCEISQLTTAGLVLGARIEKVDDNGFITFSLSPSISSVAREYSTGLTCPPVAILNVRKLDTGAVRVRDGQTLILTGVITDQDVNEVSKWPILGDMPLIGQFFRSSNRTRKKNELVIMVTPRIINDVEGGTYGYGYQAGTPQARELLNGRR